jgi:superfamily II DNA or RNA helicase
MEKFFQDIIKRGAIIEGPFWPDPIEIIEIEELETNQENFKIKIGYRNTRTSIFDTQILDKEDLKKIKVKVSELDFSAKASEVFLAIESIRLKYASLFDPFLALNTSKIDPLPFQIEAVYGYVLKLPRIRFLIADDPGAGKTIMTGLILKELKLRGLAKRILIVVPGHLKDQWIREMKEKFQETFIEINRNLMNSLYGENPWAVKNQVITSMDFAKQEDILPSLSSTHWDLVIVDEAHKMAAYRYSDKTSKTDRYKLGEILSKISTHLLFLTATPHKGDQENFRLFLDLLVPGFFAKEEFIQESINNKDNPLFIRRLKEDLRDLEGKPIFTNRYPKTIKFRLSDKEKKLYNELSEYVISQYNKALQKDKKRNIAFALLILQRRMASSTYALLKSLERRKQRLEELFKKSELEKEKSYFSFDIEEFEEYNEKERWEKEKEWETLSLAETKEELYQEINILENLIKKANEIIDEENEIKLTELKKAIEEGLKKIIEIQGNEKILIFTESKDTLDYLVQKIKSWEYSVNSIDGSMSLEDRIKAERIFRDQTQIMVATEAAGEGINLQFCHIMINYDIPWNPTRLEQRMGRIHRYGQQKDVYIFNLVAEDTREGKVLIKILEKLDEIREALGSDKVFDVIGEIFQGKNLYQLILDSVSNAKTLDEIINEIDIKVNEEYVSKIKDVLGESLATKYIDYTKIKEITQKAKEYRLVPEYVEGFFKKAFEKIGGEFFRKKDGFIKIDSIPYEIKQIANEFNFKSQYGELMKSYPKATFDKEKAFKNPDAEFISFGHPLLEALIEYINKNYENELKKGAVFEDPSCKYNGIVWFFEGEVKDGTGNIAGKKIMAIYDDGKNLQSINPAIVWDLIPIDETDKSFSIDKNQLQERKNKAKRFSIKILEDYQKEISKERERQKEIKTKYGLKSLEYLIEELVEEILKLEERKEKGEKVDLVITNKNERKNQYEEAKQKLEKEIEQEASLAISDPKFLSAIYIKPSSSESDDMVGSEEIEKIGMNIVMEYEKSQGREPEDVSKENLGYDIRSKGKNEIRYIEVKTRKDEGSIALTLNEKNYAERFKEQYWLYVVYNAASNPELLIINNPAEKLKMEEKKEVRFIITSEECKKKAIKTLPKYH